MKFDFLDDISSTYGEIRNIDINPLGKDELRDAYRRLLDVRDGFYSTNQDKMGDKANVLLRDIQKKYLKMKKNDASRN